MIIKCRYEEVAQKETIKILRFSKTKFYELRLERFAVFKRLKLI